MGEDLFGDLPPPSYHPPEAEEKKLQLQKPVASPPLPPVPRPALKSALKRPPPDSNSADGNEGGAGGKRLRFKMTTDASEAQVIDAMVKIASHIKNPSKFSKASKLTIQLIEAKSVKPSNSGHFYTILEAAMVSNTQSCHDASVRADYHALFSAANEVVEFLDWRQANQVTAWTIRAVIGNDFYTDDSFVFSKASNRVKGLISQLPQATQEDDMEEAAALSDEPCVPNERAQLNEDKVEASPIPSVEKGTRSPSADESDPFGLDSLITNKVKKIYCAKGRNKKDEEEETKRALRLKREALINCLEIASKRYKIPWCQTVIDLLVKHAFDHISRFTARQREAIDKLWASIHEQHICRKQGKSLSGKLDMNGFEWLQQKYAGEKISIRNSVGGGGDRRCQQWLG